MRLWHVATCHGFGVFVVVVKCLHRNEPYINVTFYVFVQYIINMKNHAVCNISATSSHSIIKRYLFKLPCVYNFIDTTNGVMVILL